MYVSPRRVKTRPTDRLFFCFLVILRDTSVGPHDCDIARPNWFVGLPTIHDESTFHVELTGAAPARRWGNRGYQRTLYTPCPIGPAKGVRGSIRQSHIVDLPKRALVMELARIAGEIGSHPASSPCDWGPMSLGRKSRRTREKTAECGYQRTTYQHFRFHIALLKIKSSGD
jgi:hypothetical protein